jgi:hypothetical protein
MEIRKKLKARRKGISSLLMLLVGIFILCVVVYSSTMPLEKMALQSQLNDVGRGAMFRVEAEGGLSPQTEKLIKDKLAEKGLNRDLVTIESNRKVNPSNPLPNSNYGENVTLTIKYQYKYNIKDVVGFTIKDGAEKTEELQYKTSSTAKN